MLVSGNLLSLMGVTPTIGRDFRADEDQVPGRDAVIILGRTLWEQEFDADPGVLGRRVRISGLDFTVVGVTPPSFTGMDQFVRSDFYVPLMMSPRLIADPRTASLEMASWIDEHYFDTIGISILRGRGFLETDGPDAPRVAIVNEQFAKHYWPDQDAIGKRLQAGADKTWVQVVGIAKNSKYLFIAEPTRDFVYLPYRQTQPRRMVMLARSSGEASALTGPLREVVHGLDPNLPIFNVRTMADFYRMRAVSVFHVLVTIVAGMGAMGLGLAIVGLYGLVAYAASRRTREIGIRMAIGAERATVVRLVLRQGVALALVGLAIGLVASVAAGRLMAASFPTGDTPRDLIAQLLVIPIVLAVTFAAAYVPAFQASRINPIEALRQE